MDHWRKDWGNIGKRPKGFRTDRKNSKQSSVVGIDQKNCPNHWQSKWGEYFDERIKIWSADK